MDMGTNNAIEVESASTYSASLAGQLATCVATTILYSSADADS